MLKKRQSHFAVLFFINMFLTDLLNTAKLKHPFSLAFSRTESKQNLKRIFNNCRNLWLKKTMYQKACMKLNPVQGLRLKSCQGM